MQTSAQLGGMFYCLPSPRESTAITENRRGRAVNFPPKDRADPREQFANKRVRLDQFFLTVSDQNPPNPIGFAALRPQAVRQRDGKKWPNLFPLKGVSVSPGIEFLRSV